MKKTMAMVVSVSILLVWSYAGAAGIPDFDPKDPKV